MIRGYVIRHSMTESNASGRYAGKRTDENLSPEGISLCLDRIYPQTDVVYTSPMRRCIQTAGLLYRGKKPVIREQFAECDFGIFEGKNYIELSDEPKYQEWIQYQYRTFAMVIHGGTIMSILDGFAVPHRDYFDWQVKNLEGYEIETDEKQWVIGSHEIYIRKEGSDIWK